MKNFQMSANTIRFFHVRVKRHLRKVMLANEVKMVNFPFIDLFFRYVNLYFETFTNISQLAHKLIEFQTLRGNHNYSSHRTIHFNYVALIVLLLRVLTRRTNTINTKFLYYKKV